MTFSLLKIQAVENRTGDSRDKIYRGIRTGEFPTQIGIGNDRVAWVENEIDTFLKAKVAGFQRDDLIELISRMKELRSEIKPSTNHISQLDEIFGEILNKVNAKK